MNSSKKPYNQRPAADKLLYEFIMNNYHHYQRYEYMMIIEFDPDLEEDEEEDEEEEDEEDEEEDESYYKANRHQKYIKIHLIIFNTLEIVTYQMDLNTPCNVFENLKYNTDLTCIECHGSKCRLKNSTVFCESCYDPDYLHYWELVLIKNKKSKIKRRNNTLFIYNWEDFTEIFDDLLYLFTSKPDTWHRDKRHSYLFDTIPKRIRISKKRKLELIKTMYSGITEHYCEREEKEFKVGPHPNELPIPKTLLSIK